ALRAPPRPPHRPTLARACAPETRWVSDPEGGLPEAHAAGHRAVAGARGTRWNSHRRLLPSHPPRARRTGCAPHSRRARLNQEVRLASRRGGLRGGSRTEGPRVSLRTPLSGATPSGAPHLAASRSTHPRTGALPRSDPAAPARARAAGLALRNAPWRAPNFPGATRVMTLRRTRSPPHR